MLDQLGLLIAAFEDWGLWTEVLGFAAASLTIVTYSMKTMIPLRIVGICASSLFIVYGYITPSYPQLLLHGVLLPLNTLRLRQMIRLIAEVRAAAEGDLFVDWITPFSSRQTCRKGDTVFRKGDHADSMYFVASGRYWLVEIDTEIEPGQIVGEIGLVTPENRRTQTFKCLEDGELIVVGYDRVRILYFQNPRFGFYFMKLISERLLVNMAQLEKKLAQHTPQPSDD